jgi:hypothetical protein
MWCRSSAHRLIRFGSQKRGGGGFDEDEMHYPTRPVDKDKAEQELTVNIKKATSPEESAPKQKHVRSVSQSCVMILSLIASRMHCVHMGLPQLRVILEWT